MADKYEEYVKAEWEKFGDEKRLLPNIMLLGATGCGKSSLINLVFGRYIAPVNDTDRGTKDFCRYDGKNFGLGVNLIDSRGYELSDGKSESFDSYVHAIDAEMERSRKEDPLKKIHIVWYCVSIAGTKIQDYDLQILKKLSGNPELCDKVAVILTKSDEDDEDMTTAKEFRRIIDMEFRGSLKCFSVSTLQNLPLDLEALMGWSADQIDDTDMKEAFISCQIVDLKAKRTAAGERVAFYAAAAGIIGAVPIPIADAALLVPLQVTMSAKIVSLYGLDNMAHVTKGLISSVLISNMGKALAGGLLKLIPGAGQWVGAAINTAVASGITTALGFAISEICFESCKRIAKGEKVDFDSVLSADEIRSMVKRYKDEGKNDDTYASKTFSVNQVKDFAEDYMKKHKK